MMPAFTLPSEVDVRLSIPVLLFTVATAMLSGILFGCAPVLQALRQNVNDTLKEGGRSAAAAGRHPARAHRGRVRARADACWPAAAWRSRA